jgi:hypothetical protein
MKRLALFFLGVISTIVALGPARADEAEIRQFYERVQEQLAARDFDALETLGDDLRRKEKLFAGGVSGSLLYYRALTGRSYSTNYWTGRGRSPMVDDLFPRQRASLEAWRDAKPSSPAPKIALALLWEEYAWQGRGKAFADKVLPEQWAMFNERVLKKDEILRGIVPSDAVVRHAILGLGIEESWPRETLDEFYRAAVKAHPSFFPFYVRRAHMLLPRWFGRPGELVDFAESLLRDDPGGDLGKIAYSFVAMEQMDLGFRMKEFYQKTGLRWQEIKAGFELRKQRYGLSKGDWNFLLYLACAAPDRATALEAVENIGEDWAPWLWREKKTFDVDVAWARGQG